MNTSFILIRLAMLFFLFSITAIAVIPFFPGIVSEFLIVLLFRILYFV